MSQARSKNNWKTKLPSSFDWLSKVEINIIQSTLKGAQYLVPVKTDPKKNELVIDNSKLPKDLKKELLNLAKHLGIKSKCKVIPVIYQDSTYLLTHSTSLGVSPAQVDRQLGLDLADYLADISCDHLVLCSREGFDSLDILEGLMQGLYRINGFKGKQAKGINLPGKISVLDDKAKTSDIEAKRALGQALALTRMMEDAPANWMNPERFSEIATDIAADLGITCSIKTRKDLEKMGMGSFLSVAGGSSISPQLICLDIEGENKNETVALVGKGLTFDVGGLCLKQPGGLEEMKYDMCGGAAVLGAAFYLGKMKPKTNVTCLIGAVENLVGEKATKPGDIVTAMNGKTVEIINTDAEGRLVLADVLHYACETYKPKLIIDVATLTGAVLMSLGSLGSAVMSNEQKAARYVLDVGEKIGEPLWQLPLWPELRGEIKSKVADLKNIVSPGVKAGTISAGTFLSEFVGEYPWVHIDIAGTGWNCKATGYPKIGGSGFIVKTLAQACLSFKKLS